MTASSRAPGDRACPDSLAPPDDWRARLDTEWLLTNGLGGFAMGTGAGVNTRRYHGLLIAAATPPVRRVLALHSVLERILVAGAEHWLAAMQFAPRGAAELPLLHPDGWRRLADVAVEPHRRVHWTWSVGDGTVRRTLEIAPDRNVAQLTYTARGLEGATIRLRPLTPLRDFHSLDRDNDAPPRAVQRSGEFIVQRDDLTLSMRALSGTWDERPDWWRRFAYRHDRARGQDWIEDVWSPGELSLSIDANNLSFALEFELTAPAVTAPRLHKELVSETAAQDPDRTRTLRRAAGQFLVRRRHGDAWSTSIIAGYPWFADWGRDSMISMEGLLLIDGRHEEARDLLHLYAVHIERGLIPNRFDDWSARAHYNTVDASLWFIHAVGALHRRAPSMVNETLIRACRSIIGAYQGGTDFGIRMDRDGLIVAGSPQTQLTWMDAQRNGVTFTPRHGKAIEISALWHHALQSFARLTPYRDEADQLRELARLVAYSIQTSFWRPELACCHDVLQVSNGAWLGDAKLRPNQIFAVSLDPPPLTFEQQRAIVNIVRDRLLTPFGVRTLDPDDPDYRGRYEGDLMQRDAAYHQGTVWPWLLGPLGEAILRANEFSEDARREVRAMIEPILVELDRGCLGQLAEVYDGDPPHRASGCPAQAWTIAEIRRLLALTESEIKSASA